MKIRDAIAEIAADNLTGATLLAARAAALLSAGAALPGEDLQQLALAVARAQPAMAPLLRLANAALLAADARPGDRAGAVHRAAGAFVADLRAHAAAAVAHAAGTIEGARVLTHSAGSLVSEALLRAHAAGRLVEVICTESRPALEGVDLARRLGAAGVPVRLVVDAAAPALLAQCDVLLLGADTVGAAGVVHKVGTLGLALAARHHGVPAYVLATDEKLLPEACGDCPPIPERDAAEVLPAPAPGVRAQNFYFDLTPRGCFAGVLTERGMLPDAEITARLREIVVHPALAGLWRNACRQPWRS